MKKKNDLLQIKNEELKKAVVENSLLIKKVKLLEQKLENENMQKLH